MIRTIVLVSALLLSANAFADAKAGKAKFDAVCADCHEIADYDGVTVDRAAIDKQKKHKKFTLTDAELKNVAEYLKK